MSAQISNSSKSIPHMKTSKQKPQSRNNTTCTIMEKSNSKINHSTEQLFRETTPTIHLIVKIHPIEHQHKDGATNTI